MATVCPLCRFGNLSNVPHDCLFARGHHNLARVGKHKGEINGEDVSVLVSKFFLC